MRKWQGQARAFRVYHDQSPWSQPSGTSPPEFVGVPRPITNRKKKLLELGFLWGLDATGRGEATLEARQEAGGEVVHKHHSEPKAQALGL
jgi:hypothetical protein